MPSLLAIPDAWIETYRPLPTGWWSNHAEGIERVWPETYMDEQTGMLRGLLEADEP